MSETGAQTVPEQAPPVAAPPNPSPAPAAQSDDPAALRAKLELVTRDRQAQGETNAKLNEQLAELRRQVDEATIQMKEERIATLEAELQAERNSTAAERLKSSALGAISQQGAISPEQMFALLQPSLREVGGKPVVLNGGVEQPLDTYLANLRAPGSGYEHHFSASGKSGMGTAPGGVASVAPGMENPWKTNNITQQLLMMRDNPELAQALQAEASKG